MILYVATVGEYSDYRIVGIYSTYKGAQAVSENQVFITELDNPDNDDIGAWTCSIALAECSSYYCAPASLYKTDTKFHPGDIIYIMFMPGVSPEEPTKHWHRNKTATVFAATEEHAKRKASDYAAAFALY